MIRSNGARGVGLSVMLHSAIVLSLMILGVTLESNKHLVVIDFSVQQQAPAPFQKAASAGPPPRKAVEKKAPPPVKKEIVAEVKPLPEPVKPKPLKKPEVLPKKAALAPPVTRKAPPELPPPTTEKVAAPPPEPLQVAATQPAAAEPAGPPVPAQPVDSVRPATTEPVGNIGPVGPPASQPVVSPEAHYVAAQFNFIRNEIQQRIVYPLVARRMGWQGKVKLSFVVDVDGSIRDVVVLESSGYKLLDDNAIACVKKAAPFPPPPVCAKLIIPVVFRLA